MTAAEAARQPGDEWSPLAWAPGQDLNPPATGISDGGWHAIVRAYRPRSGEGQVCGQAACGATACVAAKFGPFDPDRFPDRTCAACVWTVAIRTGTLTDRYERLAAAEGAPGLAARVAQAIVAGESWPVGGYELDHPYTVQLLSAVTAHAPTPLISEGCAEGGCEHPPGQRCPTVAVACLACSQRSGSWAGEWEGQLMAECTISAPCEVLGTLAAHFKVTGGVW